MADLGLYTVGGTVQAQVGGLYVERQADRELLRLCRKAAFAYVLTPRQLGKSSLMIRTATRLIEEGIKPVTIDVAGQIGTKPDAETWYGDFLDLVASQLELTTNVRQWWKAHGQSGITLRLTRFFEQVVLKEVAEPVVIFVDEIDTTLSLNFTDDFFAAIRYLYVARSTNEELRRLSFVLIGVATPADLIRDPKRTPFNIGVRVDLSDFTLSEALPLAEGLDLPADQGHQAMGWILGWTGGHPYLTQRLCSELVADPPQTWSEAEVDQVVADTFFGARSEQDNNLQFVRDMLTKRAPKPYERELLRTYRTILRGRPTVTDEEQNLVHAHLKLSGVVRRDGTALAVRNRIYRKVFNSAWIAEHNPEDFWTRYGPVLKWAVPVSTASIIVAIAMAALVLKAQTQTKIAQEARDRAVQSEQIARLALRNELQARDKEKKANLARLMALKIAEGQRQKAERQSLVARQAKLQAERQTAMARQQTGIARKQTRIAQLREQVERVGNLLTTADAFFGMLLSIDAWGQSRSFAALHTSSAYSLMHAVQKSREATWLQGSKDTRIAISGDGSRIVGGVKGGIGIWDGKSGALIRTLELGEGVTDVHISGDGNRIVGRVKGGIGIWDGKSGALIRTLELGEVVTDVKISGDGSRIVGGLKGGIVRIWDIESGTVVRTVQGSEEVTAVAISADGSRIVGGLTEATAVRIWDVKSGAVIREYSQNRTFRGINTLAISGDGSRIVFTEAGVSRPAIWDVKSGEVIRLPVRAIYTPSLGEIDSVAISRDGSRIVTSSLDGPVQTWNAQGKETETLKGYFGSIYSVAISGDGNRVASIPMLGTTRIWDVKSEAVIRTLQGSKDVKDVEISSDGSRVVGHFAKGTARIWDVKSGAVIQTLQGSEDVEEMVISSDGSRVVGHFAKRTVRIWDVKSGAVIRTFQGSEDVEEVATSSDGSRVVGHFANRTVRIWDVKSGAVIRTFQAEADIGNLAFSGDGSRIVLSNAINSEVGGIWIWDVKSGAVIGAFQGSKYVRAVAISSDGSRIVVHRDESVQILDGKTMAVIRTLHGSDYVGIVAISSDGNWAVGLSSDGSYALQQDNIFLQMWDVKSGKPISPPLNAGDAYHVAINGDGSRIFTLSKNKVHLWMGSTEGWLALACQRIWYNPQLRQPEKFIGDQEKIAVALRARGVCEGVVSAGVSQGHFDTADWVKGLVQRIAGVFSS